MPDAAAPLLEIQNLRKHYPLLKGLLKRQVGVVRAVDDVSFRIHAGETFGLVGESGCGKSTVAKSIIRAVEPTAGQVIFHLDRPRDLAGLSKQELKEARRQLQLVFQDPFSSLNPRQRVRDIIGEPLRVNQVVQGAALEERVSQLMTAVGLRPEYMVRYPHAFSGGQRQRIGIARALALNPKLIICDEPVSALDVSVQAQILNLLKDLQSDFGLTYLFVSHDLSVVQHISDRVAVMYVGRLVEIGPTQSLFSQPQHPYTAALLAASPKPHPRFRRTTPVLTGEVPDPLAAPSGCHFHPRCPHRQPICAEEFPPLEPVPEAPGHFAACHFAQEITLEGVPMAAPSPAGS